ncbi:MAG: hypothetical protein MUC49_20900 [Raineya sp.]|jgi:hypothetical protein|nr:hypothetical protein [Raineya sp.]
MNLQDKKHSIVLGFLMILNVFNTLAQRYSKSIDIISNQVINLNDIDTSNVNRLNIRDSLIRKIPEELFNLQSIQTICFYYNPSIKVDEQLYKDISRFKNIKEISFINKEVHLDGINIITSLESLVLSNCTILFPSKDTFSNYKISNFFLIKCNLPKNYIELLSSNEYIKQIFLFSKNVIDFPSKLSKISNLRILKLVNIKREKGFKLKGFKQLKEMDVFFIGKKNRKPRIHFFDNSNIKINIFIEDNIIEALE